MKLIQIFSIVSLLQAILAQEDDASAAFVVSIKNNTPYPATGRVSYSSTLCSSDNFSLPPAPGRWSKSISFLCRGVEKIKGTIPPTSVPGCSHVRVDPHTPTGGSSSNQYAIIQREKCLFQIVPTWTNKSTQSDKGLRGSSTQTPQADVDDYGYPSEDVDDYKPDENVKDDDANIASYLPVHIINSSPYSAQGRITYAGPGFICGNDYYTKEAMRPSPYGQTTHSRGVCLITEISCDIMDDVPGCDTVRCTSYYSSGTSYSQFSLNRVSQCAFEIDRRTGRLSDADEESNPMDDAAANNMPDEETLEDIEQKELAVILHAREAIAQIAHNGVAGDLEEDEDSSGDEPSSPLVMMKERKLSSCGNACQSCKLSCDVSFRVKEEACLLACHIPCLWPAGSVCDTCRSACRAPRQYCYRACDLVD